MKNEMTYTAHDCIICVLSHKLTDGSKVYRVDVARAGDEQQITVSFPRDEESARACAMKIGEAILQAA